MTRQTRSVHAKIRFRVPRGTSRVAIVTALEAAVAGDPLPKGWRIEYTDWTRSSKLSTEEHTGVMPSRDELLWLLAMWKDQATDYRLERVE